MPFPLPEIVGILNLTADSFSDGGRYLDPDAALARGLQLRRDGAAIIDIGAESTHPASADVPPGEQIERLLPVARGLREHGIAVSLDATHPDVVRALAPIGLTHLNSVTALRDPATVDIIRDRDCRIVLMFSRNAAAGTGRAAGPLRTSAAPDAPTVAGPRSPESVGVVSKMEPDAPAPLLAEILDFFRDRIAALTAAGIARERLILDPGMGFFLGPGVEPSLTVLRGLRALQALGLPLYVCTSRKSFLGEILADERTHQPRPVSGRGAATLATELWAAQQGAAFIRTHDVRQLHDALRTMAALYPP